MLCYLVVPVSLAYQSLGNNDRVVRNADIPLKKEEYRVLCTGGHWCRSDTRGPVMPEQAQIPLVHMHTRKLFQLKCI
jgi:hypothetical protein